MQLVHVRAGNDEMLRDFYLFQIAQLHWYCFQTEVEARVIIRKSSARRRDQ